MENITNCEEIIAIINSCPNDTSPSINTTQQTYFDYLWTWWNGTTSSHIQTITQTFKDVDLASLNVSPEELTIFYNNLKTRFQPHSNDPQLSTLIKRLNDYLYPSTQKEEVTKTRIQILDNPATRELFIATILTLEGDARFKDTNNDISAVTDLLFNVYHTGSSQDIIENEVQVARFERLFSAIDAYSTIPSQTHDTPSQSTDSSTQQKILENPFWRGPIIDKPQTIQDYAHSHFGNTRNLRKQRSNDRIMHFANQGYIMRIARGDGNCFTNSLAGGLMDVITKDPSYRETLIDKLLTLQNKTTPYVLEDNGSSAPSYSQSFTKEKDFTQVLNALMDQQEELDNDTMAALSRILRYVLTLEKFHDDFIESAPKIVGENIDFTNIYTFNKAFNLNARVLVVEAYSTQNRSGEEILNQQDPETASSIYRIEGSDPEKYFDESPIVDINQLLEQESHESFNVIRVDGHFDLMVKDGRK